MSSQYGELRPTSGWDRLASLGHPSKFQRVSRFGFVTAATSLNRSQPNFARCFGRLLGWYTIYTFSGALAPWRNFAMCKIHFTSSKSCVLVYWQRYCTALQQPASPIDLPFGLWLEWAEGCANSIVFARWRQCALVGGHVIVGCRIALNHPSTAAMRLMPNYFDHLLSLDTPT